jgi:hypothetical protein
MNIKYVTSAVILSMLAACTTNPGVWAPGPGTHVNPSVVQGKCRLLSMQDPEQSGVFGTGLIGLALIAGQAANRAARKQEIYDACMQGEGMVQLTQTQR